MTTWKWQGAEFETRALRVRDELAGEALGSRLQAATKANTVETRYFCNTFAQFIVSTSLKAGDPGLPMVTAEDDTEALVAAMNAWLDAVGWKTPWDNALAIANATPNGVELQPGTEKNVSAPPKGKGGASS